MTKTPHVELEFSRKYDRSHSEQYLKKHHEGWARRLSHWRDEQVARHALRLADDPGLDGPGRGQPPTRLTAHTTARHPKNQGSISSACW